MAHYVSATHTGTAPSQVACQVMQWHPKLGVLAIFVHIVPEAKIHLAFIPNDGHPRRCLGDGQVPLVIDTRSAIEKSIIAPITTGKLVYQHQEVCE